jgi:hypothetical protein
LPDVQGFNNAVPYKFATKTAFLLCFGRASTRLCADLNDKQDHWTTYSGHIFTAVLNPAAVIEDIARWDEANRNQAIKRGKLKQAEASEHIKELVASWAAASLKAANEATAAKKRTRNRTSNAEKSRIWPCEKWNRNSCTFPNCRWDHVCKTCHDTKHAAPDCPKAKEQKAETK